MVKDYIVSTVMINNVPQSAYEQGFEDFLQDMDDPVAFSHFLKKYDVSEGITIETHENNAGYNVPCISAYVDYNTWNSWSEEMQGFWDLMPNPELHKVEVKDNITYVSSKLTDDEVAQLIIPLGELQTRFAQ